MHYRIALAGLLTTASASPLTLKRNYNGTIAQSWKDVPISPDLKYTPCFGNYTCANLEVPLDYDNPDVGTTNIAFAKFESPNQPAKGDIIFNPGGPGGSPMEIFFGFPELLTALLGDVYNIVAMDPRGVNNSGPNLDCFEGHPAIRDYYNSQAYDVDPRSSVSISKYFETSGAFGTWCSQTLNQTANYANTPATARDMLQYAEKLAESQGRPTEEAVVNFYGASYGTALGSTYAQLFPNRVGRFIIDGVQDVEDYYFGSWSQNLLQGDESVDAFFRYCAEAGPKCALYRNGTTATEIKQRFDAVLKDLEDSPVPVVDPNVVDFPAVLTHMDFRSQIMIAMYSPSPLWPILASTTALLEKRNGTLAIALAQKGKMPLAECDATPSYSTIHPKLLIACNDNNKRFKVTKESLTRLFEDQRKLSSYFGDVWPAVIAPQCRNLNFAPPSNQLFNSELH
jgi:pimeloyl-ACP methyl ester carboxylesterase